MKETAIDINRLHAVYFGKLTGKGCGHTTLFASYLIGISHLKDYHLQNIHVLFRWMQDQENTFRVCIQTCEMEKVPYRILGKHIALINNTQFVFCHDCIQNRQGRDNTIFYDEEVF